MARNTTLLIICAALACACTCARAAQSLTLSLETPDLNETASAAKQDAPAASNSPSASDKPTQSSTVKIGRVGTVQVPTASIYQSRSGSSRRYATVKAQTPLAIVKEEGSWYGVLMVNGAVGWIPAKCVDMTGYELVAKRDAARGSVASRGGRETRAGLFGESLVRTAMQYSDNGISYRYGGTNANGGMDCSAFVQSVFAQYGMRLPRTSRDQSQVGSTVPFEQLQPGDRLYFACRNSYVDHCGIYAGNGYFVHCSASRNGIGVDSLSSDFFWRSLVVAKRS